MSIIFGGGANLIWKLRKGNWSLFNFSLQRCVPEVIGDWDRWGPQEPEIFVWPWEASLRHCLGDIQSKAPGQPRKLSQRRRKRLTSHSKGWHTRPLFRHWPLSILACFVLLWAPKAAGNKHNGYGSGGEHHDVGVLKEGIHALARNFPIMHPLLIPSNQHGAAGRAWIWRSVGWPDFQRHSDFSKWPILTEVSDVRLLFSLQGNNVPISIYMITIHFPRPCDTLDKFSSQ